MPRRARRRPRGPALPRTLEKARRMSNPLPMHPPLATLDDDAWDDLLNFIEERRVIPIVGPELLKVDTDTGPRLLYEWLAERLAAKLGVDIAQLPQPLHAERRRLLVPRHARPPRGGLHAPAHHPARASVRAAAGAAPARADHRLRPLRHHDLRSAARAGDQRRSASAARRRPRSSPTRPTASPTCRRARASCSAPSSTTCSAGCRRRRPT